MNQIIRRRGASAQSVKGGVNYCDWELFSGWPTNGGGGSDGPAPVLPHRSVGGWFVLGLAARKRKSSQIKSNEELICSMNN